MLVLLSKNSQKEYQELPKSAQKKIKKKLIALQENPYSGKKLTGNLKGVSSVRAWPYRILYEIDEQKQRIEIHKIAHRQSAYK